jgi:tetratricopeptide (TPR) repeat protein
MPRNEEAFEKAMNEGTSAAWDQEWEKAASAYRRALQEFPDQPRALNNLGLALYQLGEFTDALQTYEHVAKLSPDDPLPLEKVAQISERIGDIDLAVDAAMRAAETFLRARDIDKAIENWSRITSLRPEQPLAHSRLATAHERMGHVPQAVTEYLAVAALLQRSGNGDRAEELVTRALQLNPQSVEARQAQSLLKTGQQLPQPLRSRGGTAPLRMAKVKQLTDPGASTASNLDPVAEAAHKALSTLAEILFDYSDQSPAAQERRGLNAIVKGTGALSMEHAEQSKVVMHLGQAIDAQTRGQDAAAADELERALDAGFKHPALHFNLGYLRLKGERQESAIRHLAHAIKHVDYGLGARLLLGDILFKKEQYRDASLEYLQALQLADSLTVPEEQADDIRQVYEPLVEAQQLQKDPEASKRLCDNVRGLLMRPDWRNQVHTTREQTRRSQDADGPVPLAEVVLGAQSSGVIDSINRVHQLARAGALRSAMDEAFDAVQRSPDYLPLHILIADLLLQDGKPQDAITKLSVTAHAYNVRGEVAQAGKMWRRIIQLSPMDFSARSRLIEQLVAEGKVDDAIKEYLELADLYYRLADLDMARKTYTTALRVVQQTQADRAWNVDILQRMADIDMQRLDWKQALRVYEQIRTLRPDDQAARKALIELYSRSGQTGQVTAELEGFLTFLEGRGQTADSIPFLEDLAKDYADEPLYRRALAQQLHRLGRTQEAVGQLDDLGELMLQRGRNDEAAEVIQQILGMNPANASQYRQLLTQLTK